MIYKKIYAIISSLLSAEKCEHINNKTLNSTELLFLKERYKLYIIINNILIGIPIKLNKNKLINTY